MSDILYEFDILRIVPSKCMF